MTHAALPGNCAACVCSVAISTWWRAGAAIPLMVIRLPFLWPVAARHLTNLPEAAGPGCAPPA